MSGDAVDRLAEVLVGMTPDVLETVVVPIVDALGEMDPDDGASASAWTEVVTAAVVGVAGPALRRWVEAHPGELERAVAEMLRGEARPHGRDGSRGATRPRRSATDTA